MAELFFFFLNQRVTENISHSLNYSVKDKLKKYLTFCRNLRGGRRGSPIKMRSNTSHGTGRSEISLALLSERN